MLFCGSGATHAVNKLVGLLGLRIPEPLEREFGLLRHIPLAKRPVVFVGPYEHHSNELPWRESIADVVEVGLRPDGHIDLTDLEAKLVMYAARPLRIGAFSAASNVSGILSDVRALARILHRHGALAVFDYAAAAPYVPIDMHPPADADADGDADADAGGAHIDALFLSTHKFMAGPQASGVLVAHRDLFRTRRPERPGGGTVDYVSAGGRRVDYTARLEDREEGGTPAIMGDLRAGAAFLVKELVGAANICAHEQAIAAEALARLARHPRIRLLGSLDQPRLAIISFNVEGLHHDFVSALLDQLFGIQNRAGCACAGPYGHRLLGIDDATSERFRALIARGVIGMKPGWVRLSLPYYGAPEDIAFILDAVLFVADHGDAFLPAYCLSWQDGVWRHLAHPAETPPPIVLDAASLLAEARAMTLPRTDQAGEATDPRTSAELAAERQGYLAAARELAAALEARWRDAPPAWNPPMGDAEVDRLAWFRYVHTTRLQ